MTSREYLDLLVRTSAAGGFPAVTDTGDCLYAAENGRRCAIGVLLPPGEVPRDANGLGVQNLLARRPRLRAYLPAGMTLAELAAVQEAHDEMADAQGWDHGAFVARLESMGCFRG